MDQVSSRWQWGQERENAFPAVLPDDFLGPSSAGMAADLGKRTIYALGFLSLGFSKPWVF
jgi:hypothetical protein